jgi:hypothetical protein
MLASAFTAITSLEVVFLRKYNEAVLRKIVFLLFQLIALGKTFKFFTHGDAKVS